MVIKTSLKKSIFASVFLLAFLSFLSCTVAGSSSDNSSSSSTSSSMAGGPYDFSISLSNMNPHIGQLFKIRVVDLSNMAEVTNADIFPVAGPDFMFNFPSILVSGKSYYVDFYADLNKNLDYDAPPADHAWRYVLSNVSGMVMTNFFHNTTFTDVQFPPSDRFNFRMTLSNMTPHVRNLVEFRLLDWKTNEVQRLRGFITTNYFSILLSNAFIDYGSYRLDFYADLNRNGAYDAPPADHEWTLWFSNTQGNTVYNFVHNTTFTTTPFPGPSTNFAITVVFSNMAPHVGQSFYYKIYDKAGFEVVRTNFTISTNFFTVSYSGFSLSNHTYNLDFYADFNNNGNYDAPPVDHAWRLTITNIAANFDYNFVHNTVFSDILW